MTRPALIHPPHTTHKRPEPTKPAIIWQAGSRGIWKDTRPKPLST